MVKITKERKEEIRQQLPDLISEGKTRKEIALELKIGASTLDRYCKEWNIHVPNHHNALKFDDTIFDIIDSEEKAYWLGFIYADGSINTTGNTFTINLARKDESHLKKFKDFVKSTKPIMFPTVKGKDKNYETCRIDLCSKHFKESLIKLGVIPNKSLILTFPNTNIFTDASLIKHFIRGYVDGDGCLTFSRNGRAQLNILGTKEFLKGVFNYFSGYFSNIHKIARLQTNVYCIQNCGNHADYVLNELYSSATIYLDRKYERFVALCRNT